MNWWCSAQDGPWTWAWQPYLGVWVIVGLLVTWYALSLQHGTGTDRAGERRASYGQVARYLGGVTVFWLAADWPVGALGAGYLLSVHTLQYILFVFVAPPLLITGTPRWLLRRLIRHRFAFSAAGVLSRPLIAFAVFNIVMLGTHLPNVVDGLTVSQLGSFAVSMAWFASGIVFWWPVVAPLPELNPLPYPGRLVYLIMNIFIPTVPASFMAFADYPIYALYELAPPTFGLTATEDQQIAGIAMKLIGGLILFGTGTVLFFKWWSAEDTEHELDTPGGERSTVASGA